MKKGRFGEEHCIRKSNLFRQDGLIDHDGHIELSRSGSIISVVRRLLTKKPAEPSIG